MMDVGAFIPAPQVLNNIKINSPFKKNKLNDGWVLRRSQIGFIVFLRSIHLGDDCTRRAALLSIRWKPVGGSRKTIRGIFFSSSFALWVVSLLKEETWEGACPECFLIAERHTHGRGKYEVPKNYDDYKNVLFFFNFLKIIIMMIKKKKRGTQKKKRGEKKLVVDWLLESNSAADSKGVAFFSLAVSRWCCVHY